MGRPGLLVEQTWLELDPAEETCVSPERMRAMAALLPEPKPIYCDRNAVDGLPLELVMRTINKEPLGLSFIINMLLTWGEAESLRHIVMRFPRAVPHGERVVARGAISVLRE